MYIYTYISTNQLLSLATALFLFFRSLLPMIYKDLLSSTFQNINKISLFFLFQHLFWNEE